MSLIAEILTGISGVIDPDPIRPEDLRGIGGLAAGWRRRLQLWMFGGPKHEAGLIPWVPATTPGWLRCWDALSDDLDLTPVVQALADAGQDELAIEVMALMKQARASLMAVFPQIEIEEVGGNIRVPPSDDEAWDWVACCSVLDSTERFIQELEMGTIEDRQVEMFSATYPETFQLLHETISTMAQEAKANGISIPWQCQDVILRAALLAEPQQPAVVLPAEDVPEPKSGGSFKASDELTAAQKTAAPSTAL